MHKHAFCQKLFDKALKKECIHEKRKDCLSRFVGDLLDYDIRLSVTEIGKKLSSKATVKSKIKAAHYFVSNEKLEKDIPAFYTGFASFFWKGVKEITLLVDWTGACNEEYFILNASVAGHGRSIPIYHEIHSKSEQEKPEIHQQFLMKLKEILPKETSVKLITDAAFHRSWFEQVKKLGWDFIGRIYSCYYYQRENRDVWESVKELESTSSHHPHCVGLVQLGKTKQAIEGYLYTYKQIPSKRIRKKKNKYPTHEKAHSEAHRKGWVLFSSLKRSPERLIQYYKKRMQVEQNFRDIKNETWGVGLRSHSSSGKTRVNMLYFLATLLVIICWWFGLLIETLNRHRSYQANTIKNKRVRSFIHLARMAFRHQPELFNWDRFLQVVQRLQTQYHLFIESGVLN